MNGEFFVPGAPVPQGSHRAFVRGDKAVLVATTHKLLKWRKAISDEAVKQMAGEPPSALPVSIYVRFFFPAIQDKRKMLRRPTKRPDVDKLCRAVLDALTGVIYLDDSQVVQLMATKEWGGKTGGVVVSFASTIREAEPETGLPSS